MPNDWDDDDFDQDDSNLVKDLRKQIKDLNSKVRERDERLNVLEPQIRTSSLTSILSDLNIKDPRVAKLMPKEIDVTKENVEQWLSEYGDLFSIQSGTTDDAGATDAQPQTQTNDGQPQGQNQDWERFQSQSNATGATTPDLESQQIALLQRANEASGGNVDTYFAMLRGEIPIPS